MPPKQSADVYFYQQTQLIDARPFKIKSWKGCYFLYHRKQPLEATKILYDTLYFKAQLQRIVTKAYPNYCFYFEVVLLDTDVYDLRLGFRSKDGTFCKYLNPFQFKCVTGGDQVAMWTEKDVVSCYFFQGELQFCINGVLVFSEKINFDSEEEIIMLPLIEAASTTSVFVNVGSLPFQYPKQLPCYYVREELELIPTLEEKIFHV